MPNYQNGKVYKLVSPSTNKIYIGSTVRPLKTRLDGHVRSYQKYNTQNGNYVSSFEILKFGDYEIVEIEKIPCSTKKELTDAERRVMQDHKDICVNNHVPGRTLKQYKQQFLTSIKDLQNTRNWISENERCCQRESSKIKCYCSGEYYLVDKSIHKSSEEHVSWVQRNPSAIAKWHIRDSVKEMGFYFRECFYGLPVEGLDVNLENKTYNRVTVEYFRRDEKEVLTTDFIASIVNKLVRRAKQRGWYVVFSVRGKRRGRWIHLSERHATYDKTYMEHEQFSHFQVTKYCFPNWEYH